VTVLNKKPRAVQLSQGSIMLVASVLAEEQIFSESLFRAIERYQTNCNLRLGGCNGL
jgi:hypothetical protein